MADDLDDLAAELSEFAPPEKAEGRPPREERVIAGFQEIQRFVDAYGRLPQHGEDRDIFERLYAIRLDRFRAQPDCRAVIASMDRQGLLGNPPAANIASEPQDVDELAAELAGVSDDRDISKLRHVRPSAEKRAAEEIAQRRACAEFEHFQPLFEQVRRELKDGVRQAHPLRTLDEIAMNEIQQGEFFIVEGQFAYIAEIGEEIRKYDRRDSRLRVIYDNGTESDVLLRSFQRALHRDETARLITNPSAGPLFSDSVAENDQESGTIYVVRSKSQLPTVAEHRELLHKIGVTGQDNIATRFTNAKNDATFLLADVEVVATYDLYNINRAKLERLIHRVFDPARLEIQISDRFGKPVVPREWFLVPLFVIDEAVDRIRDGSITTYVYDPKSARLVKVG